MNKVLKLTLLLIVASGIGACATYYDTVMKSTDTDLKYEAAFKFYNNGKFKKAAEVFESLKLATTGTPQEDTVNFYLGMSNYKFGDYIAAEANFDQFAQIFPRSPFTEESRFLRILCLYETTLRYELDQTPTRKAMMVIGEFMYDNPGSEYYPKCQEMMAEFTERLDKKSLESAKLYYKMEDYKAAHYALRNVLKENAENQYREEVLYYTALASYHYALNSISDKQKDRFLSFLDDYLNFISEYPESIKKKELEGLYNKAQNHIGRKEVVENKKSNSENN